MLINFFSLIAARTPVDGIPLGPIEPATDAYSRNSAEVSGEAAITNLEKILSNTIGFITILGGLFFLFYFVIAAFQWITAGGDSGKMSKAQNQMTQGVLGMIIIVASYTLVGLIAKLLGVEILDLQKAIQSITPGASS